MIVDTNALSAAADDDTAIIAILGRADQMAIPVIVLGEYHFGIAPPRHRAMQENWLTCLPHHCVVLDVTEATTRYHAEIPLEPKRQGKPVPTNDLWIAALCRQPLFRC